MKGLFITLEGTEGAGKSTLVPIIKEYLESKGRKVLTVREPGGSEICEQIRQILVSVNDNEKLCDTAELLLMYASRAQLVETFIKPKLKEGFDIICDRHDLSSIAYQGGGRGISMDKINKIREIAIGNFRPDITLLLDIDLEIGIERAKSRGKLDRFEREAQEFFLRVKNAYLDYAKTHTDLVHIIDASKDLDIVKSNVIKALEEKL